MLYKRRKNNRYTYRRAKTKIRYQTCTKKQSSQIRCFWFEFQPLEISKTIEWKHSQLLNNNLCVNRWIEMTAIRICIGLKRGVKLPWMGWLSGLLVLRRSRVRIIGTASRIHCRCCKSMDLWQTCWIGSNTVSLLNWFCFQRQFINCLQKEMRINITYIIGFHEEWKRRKSNQWELCFNRTSVPV